MNRRTLVTWLALLLSALLVAPAAWAHEVRGEVVFLDIGEMAVAVEIQVPLSQLHAAAPELYRSSARLVSEVQVALVPEYVRTRLLAFDRDHRKFETSVREAHVARVSDGEALIVTALLRPTGNSDARWFELHDEIILQRLVTHTVYVFLRRDLRTGAFGDNPSLLGQLHYQQRSLVVDGTSGSRWSAFRHVFQLGMQHIADGTDHLLFLLMLLLPAPLVASFSASRGWLGRRRWEAHGTIRKAALAAAKIVTAFTVGHSLTLVASSLFALSISSRASAAIEVLIAASILISAMHALRPLFPGREALVAALFGLVHGLAFAAALTGFGFDATTLALSVLGFNLGVEAMQLTIVLLTVPLLAVLGRGQGYSLVRSLGGAFGALAAIAWIAERSFGLHTPISSWVTALTARGPWLLGALVVMTLIDITVRRQCATPSG